MSRFLDIAEVSERSGISTSALRYYEKRKLIEAIGRNGLRRQYEASVLQEIALITLAKSAGFTLDEISGVLGRSEIPVLPREALLERADKLEYQAKRLGHLADMLRHTAHCSYDDHFECPRFQKLLKIATRVAKAKA